MLSSEQTVPVIVFSSDSITHGPAMSVIFLIIPSPLFFLLFSALSQTACGDFRDRKRRIFSFCREVFPNLYDDDLHKWNPAHVFWLFHLHRKGEAWNRGVTDPTGNFSPSADFDFSFVYGNRRRDVCRSHCRRGCGNGGNGLCGQGIKENETNGGRGING